MSEKMDYLESAKEFQERLCGEARANTEKLWWASTKFPEELAAWVSALLDKVRQEQAEFDANLVEESVHEKGCSESCCVEECLVNYSGLAIRKAALGRK